MSLMKHDMESDLTLGYLKKQKKEMFYKKKKKSSQIDFQFFFDIEAPYKNRTGIFYRL